jgi:hypothetical protein
MAACGTWVYRNVDSGVFKKLQLVGQKQGVTIPNQAAGAFRMKVSAFSIAFQYKLDPPSRLLQLTCIDKPALLSCAIVKSYADKIIRDCGGQPA